MNKLIFEGKEYEIIYMDADSFILEEEKTTPPMILTAHKPEWDDPDSKTIQRKYKGIKIGSKNFAYKLIV